MGGESWSNKGICLGAGRLAIYEAMVIMHQISLLAWVIAFFGCIGWIVLLSRDYYRAAKVTGWIAGLAFVVWFVTSLKWFA